MAELIVISWRDIPAQVVAREGRNNVKVVLADRFQEAIDMAATRVGLIGTDDYLDQWRRTTRSCGPDLSTEAHGEAERLAAAYPDEVLERLIAGGGLGDGGGSM